MFSTLVETPVEKTVAMIRSPEREMRHACKKVLISVDTPKPTAIIALPTQLGLPLTSVFSLKTRFVAMRPLQGNNVVNEEEFRGNVVICTAAGLPILSKAKLANKAGAAALLVIQDELDTCMNQDELNETDPLNQGMSDLQSHVWQRQNKNIRIPCALITKCDGKLLLRALLTDSVDIEKALSGGTTTDETSFAGRFYTRDGEELLQKAYATFSQEAKEGQAPIFPSLSLFSS